MVALVQTVLDNFNDNSIGGSWDNWGTTHVVETSQQLQLTTTTGASNYYGIDWTPDLNLDGVYVGLKLVDKGGVNLANVEVYPVIANINSTNSFYWFYNHSSGNLSCWTKVNGVTTQRGSSLAYVALTHVYLAVGINGANLEYLWSTNGTDWTVHATQSNPFGVTTTSTVTIEIGTGASTASTRTMIVEDFSTWTTAVVPDLEGSGDPITATGTLTSTGTKGGVGSGAAVSDSISLSSTGAKAATGTGASISAIGALEGSGGATGSHVAGTGLAITGSLSATGQGTKGAIGSGTTTSMGYLTGSGVGEIPAIYLTPPAQPTGAFHDGVRRWKANDLWRFYGFSQGLAIVKINGLWTTTTAVNLDEVEEFYQGGMRHELTPEKAEELTIAGFGEYISG